MNAYILRIIEEFLMMFFGSLLFTDGILTLDRPLRPFSVCERRLWITKKEYFLGQDYWKMASRFGERKVLKPQPSARGLILPSLCL